MSVKVKLYTKTFCPYCIRVKQYLKQQKIDFEDINVGKDPALYSKIKQETGHQTVPIVFINGEFIGGSDDFFEHIQTKPLS